MTDRETWWNTRVNTAAMLCMGALFTGCAAEVTDSSEPSEDARIRTMLEEQGFAPEEIAFGEDGVTLQGDMVFSRDQLLAVADGEIDKARWLTNYDGDGPNFGDGSGVTWSVGPGVSANIVDELWIDPWPDGALGDALPSGWSNAFYYARLTWSRVSGSNINIGWDTGGDWWKRITVKKCSGSAAGKGSSTIAWAAFPDYGLPGHTICVNEDNGSFGSLTGREMRKYALHEIGHALGFAHCDESNSFSDVIDAPGDRDDVCNNNQVMKTGQREMTDLSSNEKTAVAFQY